MPDNGQQNWKIWRDGRIVNWEDATIHVVSHVVHYGSGVFEGIRSYDTPDGPAVFRLRDHMQRLVESCRIYRMHVQHSVDDLCQAVLDTVAVNNLRASYIRPVVIRTGNDFGIGAEKVPVETFVIARPSGAYLGVDGLSKGVDVCVSSWRRSAPDTLPSLAKAAGNYLTAQLAKMEADKNGYLEAIMLDSFGFVAEGSGENLFVVRNGVLYTTPLASSILNGITRDSIIQLAKASGLEVRVENIPREALYTADEMFFSGTAVEVTPIRSVDRVPVGNGSPGAITLALQEEFMGIAQGRLPDRYGWRTLVPQAAAVA